MRIACCMPRWIPALEQLRLNRGTIARLRVTNGVEYLVHRENAPLAR